MLTPSVTDVACCAEPCTEPCTVGLWEGRLVGETTQLCHPLDIEAQNADNCTGCSRRAGPSHSIPEVK